MLFSHDCDKDCESRERVLQEHVMDLVMEVREDWEEEKAFQMILGEWMDVDKVLWGEVMVSKNILGRRNSGKGSDKAKGRGSRKQREARHLEGRKGGGEW